MTQEEITEGNKLIAEFMGYGYRSDSNYFGNYFYCKPQSNVVAFSEKKCKYHNDWNWLMTVCQKINVIYYSNREDMFLGLMHCDIEETFNGVVKFLKFWNDPKQEKLTWTKKS